MTKRKFIVKPYKSYKPKLRFGDVIQIREGNKPSTGNLDVQKNTTDEFVYFEEKENKPEMKLFDDVPLEMMKIIEDNID